MTMNRNYRIAQKRDRLIREMEKEEQRRKDREELKQAMIRVLLFAAGILIACVIYMAARNSMEASEVMAASKQWEYVGTFKTTGYCNCRKCAGKWAGGPTASGAWPEEGVTIAVDKRVIPLGTRVRVNGHEYIAQDTGVRGQHIDVYYNDHRRAWNHGVQYMEVEVLR